MGIVRGVLLACLLMGMVVRPVYGDKRYQGQAYMDLRQVVKELGFNGKYRVVSGEKGVVEVKHHKIVFTKEKRVFQFNGYNVALGMAVWKSGGQLWIGREDYEKVVAPLVKLCYGNGKRREGGVRVVVLDAGHGGVDKGTYNLNYNVVEKELTLDLGKRLRRLLEGGGYEVVMTRERDVFIELEDRVKYANERKGDIFVSLHFNGVGGEHRNKVEGIETYVLTLKGHPSSGRSNIMEGDRVRYEGNGYDWWNTILGFSLQKSMVDELGGVDRGLKRARFRVLLDLKCPGVLVECGFVSHPQECKKLMSGEYRQRIAQSIYDGIERYDRMIRGGGVKVR